MKIIAAISRNPTVIVVDVYASLPYSTIVRTTLIPMSTMETKQSQKKR